MSITTSTSTSPTYHEALTLDIHTLSLLLQRNHDQHRRCIYYRRMTMVFSAIRCLPSFDKVNEWVGQFKVLVRLLMDDESREEGCSTVNSIKRRRRKEEQWTLENNDDINSEHDNHILQQQQQQQLNRLVTIIQQLKTLLTQTLPQIKSRILHATSPILCEISRGYFVPFLTVALACLGRIHTLCLTMGREVVMVLQECIPQLRGMMLCGDDDKKKRRGIVYGGGGGGGMESMGWERLEKVVMPQFVVERRMNGREQGRNSMVKTVSSQEWNDLMTHFLDVSQDDLTKQMNVFVKEKRWEDAMSSFGLQRNVVSSCSSNPSELSVTHLGSGHVVGDYGGPSDDDDDDETETNVNTSKSNDPSSHHDMGELVDNMNPTCDDNQDKSQNAVDDNMARIMKRGKEGKKRPATTTPATSESSLVSEKKRRKRKKGKRSTVVVVAAGGISSDDNNERQQLQLQSSGVNSVDSEMVEGGELESLANVVLLGEDNEANTKESERIAESTGVEEEAMTTMTVRNPDSSIRTEEKDSSEGKQQKKSKKKSSKKAKKQKRKSSVIDDIFGF